MKKLTMIVSTFVLASSLSSAFADVKVAAQPDAPFTGKDYVGEVVAAQVVENSNNQQNILIMTKADAKNNEGGMKALTLSIDKNDFPVGLTLANAVGKKIAVTFKNANYDIQLVTIITDTYWHGDNTAQGNMGAIR